MKKTILWILLCVLISVSAVCAETDSSDQIALIAQHADEWKQDVNFGLWCYAVTDLDQNGRLEVIAASVQGTGLFTYINIYEVSEDGTELIKVQQDRPEGTSAPDIIVPTVPVYYDKDVNRRYYIFEDYIRNGYAESYYAMSAVYLENDIWEEHCMASGSVIYTDEEHFTAVYNDVEGPEITEEQYRNIAEKYYGSLESADAEILWQSVDNESFAALTPEAFLNSLEDSFAGFKTL